MSGRSQPLLPADAKTPLNDARNERGREREAGSSRQPVSTASQAPQSVSVKLRPARAWHVRAAPRVMPSGQDRSLRRRALADECRGPSRTSFARRIDLSVGSVRHGGKFFAALRRLPGPSSAKARNGRNSHTETVLRGFLSTLSFSA